MSLVEVNNLSYGVPQASSLLQEGVTFSLENGQLLLVSGPNGSGKSLLLRVLLGKSPHQAGRILFSVKNENIEFVPQLENEAIHLPLTVEDILRFSSQRVYSKEKALSFGLLQADQLKLSWNSCSGGERKRTLLTRAMMNDPEILILDEPMNHLDRESRVQIGEALSAFLAQSKMRSRGVILVCHEGFIEDETRTSSLTRLRLPKRVRHHV